MAKKTKNQSPPSSAPVKKSRAKSAGKSVGKSVPAAADANAPNGSTNGTHAPIAIAIDAESTTATGADENPSTNANTAESPVESARLRKVAQAALELDHVFVKGAAEHNLKHIDIEIPKRQLVVFTGVSGSGKTSLAFDTIFAEGQRRYVESLSSYARQFLGQQDKPKYETIRGLAPTISIEQKSASKNPRSTVGTITEIHDYLRVLFARVGIQHCHQCKKPVGRGDAQSMVDEILALGEGQKILLLSPLIENRKGEHKELFGELKAAGFARVRINGIVHELSAVTGLEKNKKHNIEVVVDRLALKETGDTAFRKRLTDSVETALRYGNGRLVVHVQDREDIPFSEARSCCGHAFPALEPAFFSFNNPRGACAECSGLGVTYVPDAVKIVPNQWKTIEEGAVRPWANYFSQTGPSSWNAPFIEAFKRDWRIDYKKPWKELPKKHRDAILYGTGSATLKLVREYHGKKKTWNEPYAGLMNIIPAKWKEMDYEGARAYFQQFMSVRPCPGCNGKRLRTEAQHVKVGGKTIIELTEITIGEAHTFVNGLTLDGNHAIIADELLKEIGNRLRFLVNVGLDYLTLDRPGPTLSGGEAQRIRLASQVGSELTGVIYILDEPSIGLHPRDSRRLINTLKHLRDIGNTVLVVEHDLETIEEADYIIDFGPGAGHLGGQIVASGTPAEIKNNPHSLTGKYLGGHEFIALPETRRAPGKQSISIVGATENNLKDVTVKFPLGLFVGVTGVSGAGKSTLINQILYPAVANFLHGTEHDVGAHKRILGLELIDKVIDIDQQPIGRTPRSNPATYTKVFDHIRDFFVLLPESQIRGYKPGRFSFNVKGGRCEACQGQGAICVEMHFLADVYVPCEVCKGRRFNAQTLEVRYKGFSIADVLDLSVSQARDVFEAHPPIARILDTMIEVGMGYVKLGQSSTTLSGGEAQRIKLSRELAKRDTGHTLYILDEPTTGLHFDDVKKLLGVLRQLVDTGNTVIVIEHNLDVIKTCDWLIDLGPEGGANGGTIVAQGSPETVAAAHAAHAASSPNGANASTNGRHPSYTAQFLADHLTTSRHQ